MLVVGGEAWVGIDEGREESDIPDEDHPLRNGPSKEPQGNTDEKVHRPRWRREAVTNSRAEAACCTRMPSRGSGTEAEPSMP